MEVERKIGDSRLEPVSILDLEDRRPWRCVSSVLCVEWKYRLTRSVAYIVAERSR